MPSINLAPGTQYLIIARKRRFRLYSIAVVIIVIFLIGGGGLYIYKTSLESESAKIVTQIEDMDQKIKSLHDDAMRVAFFEKRLTDTSQLLDSHIGWNAIFADLERLLPADTVFIDLNASSDNGNILVRGTTQNMDQVGLALASLTTSADHPTVFESGKISSIQRQAQKNEEAPAVILYSFDMILNFNKSVLRKATL